MKYGLIALGAATALLAVAIWSTAWEAWDTPPEFGEPAGNEPGPSLFNGWELPSLTVTEEVTTEHRGTGTVEVERRTRYSHGEATRIDRFTDFGALDSIEIRAGPVSRFDCTSDNGGACSKTVGFMVALDLDRLKTPRPVADPSLIERIPTASSTTSQRTILGELTTCTLAQSPLGDDEECETADDITLYSRTVRYETIRTVTVLSFSRSVPDGIFIPPYPVITPTATP